MRELVRAGRIKGVRIGARWRVSRRALIKFTATRSWMDRATMSLLEPDASKKLEAILAAPDAWMKRHTAALDLVPDEDPLPEDAKT